MAQPQKFASVAVPTPLRGTFVYTYTDPAPVRGSRVRVPFGRQSLVGVVTAIDASTDVAADKLKPITEVLDHSADLTEPVMHLCEWCASYYEHPIGDIVSNALPGLLRQGWNPMAPDEHLVITAHGRNLRDEDLGRAPAQRGLIQLLRLGAVEKSSLADQDISSRTVKAVIDKGWACWDLKAPAPMAPFEWRASDTAPPTLTEEQEQALASVNVEKPLLLQGITGSGKTEVYLRTIEPILKAGKQVLILVPEIGLTPQTINRFTERLNVPVVPLHSGLNDKERAENWMKAKSGAAGIVLGTRSAIFTPFHQLGAVIVDEEHDVSYKQTDGFRYSARDLAVLRAQFEQIPVILGSATPSLESLHNVGTGKYRRARLTQRPPGTMSETYELIDTRHLEVRDGFTRALKHRMEEELTQGHQILVFLNRRGFAPVLICNNCQWIAQCQRCDARLTYHLNIRTLVCHHCGAMYHNIISCHACGSDQVAAIGLGTQRIEQTLSQLFPNVPVMRIDRDTTRRKGAMAAFVDEINRGEPAILVGTQLLAKGHHFPGVTLVALLDADAGFYSTDFRAIERLGQLILQVGGRAGRADRPGHVMIQTGFATHPLLVSLVNEGYEPFARAMLEERRETELPPYSACVLIRAESTSQAEAREFLESVVTKTHARDSVNLLGPFPALMEKRAGRYRQMLMLTSKSRSILHSQIRAMIAIAETLPGARKVRWSVDVDPIDTY